MITFTNSLPFAFYINTIVLDVSGCECIQYPNPLLINRGIGEFKFKI